jgi:hypothetical protein
MVNQIIKISILVYWASKLKKHKVIFVPITLQLINNVTNCMI